MINLDEDDQDLTIDASQGDILSGLTRAKSKLYNDGYRIGKVIEEEKQMQLGFDQGFTHGMKLGKACGKLYGACRSMAATRAATLTQDDDNNNNNNNNNNEIIIKINNTLQKLHRLMFEVIPTRQQQAVSDSYSSSHQQGDIQWELPEDILLEIKNAISELSNDCHGLDDCLEVFDSSLRTTT